MVGVYPECFSELESKMGRRTREDWLALFDQQDASALSVAAFCKREGLSAGYFSQRKKHYGWNDGGAAMPAKGFVEIKPPVATGTIRLKWNAVDLEIPPGISVNWVAKLMQELADAAVQ
jgi:hypothetical protein